MTQYKTHKLCEIPFCSLSKKETLKIIEEKIRNKVSTFLVTPNPEMIIESEKDEDFKKLLQSTDIQVADGIGILWATRFLTIPLKLNIKTTKLIAIWQTFYSLCSIIFYPPFIQKHIPERICGSDLFWDIIKMCDKNKKRPFFLGAAPGVAFDVRDKVLNLYPNIQIAGAYSGNPIPENDEQMRYYIEKSKADIVFVAYGAPKQEFWIQRNLKEFSKPKMCIGVGGTFDFVTGKKKRAPKIMRKFGLEWLFRLFIEPTRYIRIYTATWKFIKFIFNKKINNL